MEKKTDNREVLELLHKLTEQTRSFSDVENIFVDKSLAELFDRLNISCIMTTIYDEQNQQFRYDHNLFGPQWRTTRGGFVVKEEFDAKEEFIKRLIGAVEPKHLHGAIQIRFEIYKRLLGIFEKIFVAIKRVETPLLFSSIETELSKPTLGKIVENYNKSIAGTFDKIEMWHDSIDSIEKISRKKTVERLVTELFFSPPIKVLKLNQIPMNLDQLFNDLRKNLSEMLTDRDRFIMYVSCELGLLRRRVFFRSSKRLTSDEMIRIIIQKLRNRYEKGNLKRDDWQSFLYEDFRRWYTSSFTHRIAIGADIIILRAVLEGILENLTASEIQEKIDPLVRTASRITGQKKDNYLKEMFDNERLQGLKTSLKENLFYAWYETSGDVEWYQEQLEILPELINRVKEVLLDVENKSSEEKSKVEEILMVLEEHSPLSLEMVYGLGTISYVSFPILVERRLLGNFIGATRSEINQRTERTLNEESGGDIWFFYNSFDFERNFKERGRILSTVVNDVLRPLLFKKSVQDTSLYYLEYIGFLCRHVLLDQQYFNTLRKFLVSFLRGSNSFLKRRALKRCGQHLAYQETLSELVSALIEESESIKPIEIGKYFREFGVLYKYLQDNESKPLQLEEISARLVDSLGNIEIGIGGKSDIILAMEDISINAHSRLKEKIYNALYDFVARGEADQKNLQKRILCVFLVGLLKARAENENQVWSYLKKGFEENFYGIEASKYILETMNLIFPYLKRNVREGVITFFDAMGTRLSQKERELIIELKRTNKNLKTMDLKIGSLEKESSLEGITFLNVLSQKGGVGKTLISLGLGRMLQEKRVKTCVIELDFLGPSIAYFLHSPKPGGPESDKLFLNDFILAENEEEIKVSDLIWNVDGISVIPCSLRRPEQIRMELELQYEAGIGFVRGKLERLATRLKKLGYKCIIFDTPAEVRELNLSVSHFTLFYDGYNVFVALPDSQSLAALFKLLPLEFYGSHRNCIILNKISSLQEPAFRDIEAFLDFISDSRLTNPNEIEFIGSGNLMSAINRFGKCTWLIFNKELSTFFSEENIVMLKAFMDPSLTGLPEFISSIAAGE